MPECETDNAEIDALKEYISKNNDTMICALLRENPKYLLQIPKEKRKHKYILCAISKERRKWKQVQFIFSSLDDDEKSARIWEIAIKNDYRRFQYIPEHIKTEEFILRAIDKNGFIIEYIDNPTPEMCMRAVISNPYTIGDIKNPTEEMWLHAIANGDGIIFYIKNPTEKMMAIALKTQGLYNKWRKMPQYYNAVLLYMKKYGASLKHIQRRFKTYEVCKAAIESSPHAIKYVNKSTLRKHPDLTELATAKWGK